MCQTTIPSDSKVAIEDEKIIRQENMVARIEEKQAEKESRKNEPELIRDLRLALNFFTIRLTPMTNAYTELAKQKQQELIAKANKLVPKLNTMIEKAQNGECIKSFFDDPYEFKNLKYMQKYYLEVIEEKKQVEKEKKEKEREEKKKVKTLELEEEKKAKAAAKAAAKEEKQSKVDEDKLSDVNMVKMKIVNISKDRFRREYDTGVIYEKKLPYYYTRKYEDPKQFLNAILRNDVTYKLFNPAKQNDILNFIKTMDWPGFEFIDLNYDMIGFSNGIYDLSTATFTATEDITINVQVRKYIDMPFEILKDTPLLDSYFNFQFEDPAVVEFIYFMIGRLMTRLNDKFDFMVLLYGEGGSGKSLLLNLVKYCFGSDQVGIISNSLQETFGLSELASKQMIACDDMPHNIAKVLQRSDFLSMMTRGSVSCPVKGKKSIEVDDWNRPTIINSNQLPNYTDHAGEIVRRVMMINFEKVIDKDMRNNSLEADIIATEYPTFLHRCRSTYLKFYNEHKRKSVDSFCPEVFLTNKTLLRAATNQSYQFISEQYGYILYIENDSNTYIPVTTLKQEFKGYLIHKFDLKRAPKDTLNIETAETVDHRYKTTTLTICKHCRNLHRTGCCKSYNREDRTSLKVIKNIHRVYPNV